MRQTRNEKEDEKIVKKKMKLKMRQEESAKEMPKGITLIALVITIIFSYDENVKSSNNKGFLLQTI